MIRAGALEMDELIEHSFKDYHQKGFDYVCLKRTPLETVKVYFFDGDVSKLSEVVNPHDHRYDFLTTTISGAVENVDFVEAPDGDVFQAFDFRTPLNGGDGFAWRGETRLRESDRTRCSKYQSYILRGEDLHTIKIAEPETILCLVQLQDKLPIDTPTTTYTRDREPPSLSGLYSKFTPDQMRSRISLLNRLGGMDLRC